MVFTSGASCGNRFQSFTTCHVKKNVLLPILIHAAHPHPAACFRVLVACERSTAPHSGYSLPASVCRPQLRPPPAFSGGRLSPSLSPPPQVAVLLCWWFPLPFFAPSRSLLHPPGAGAEPGTARGAGEVGAPRWPVVAKGAFASFATAAPMTFNNLSAFFCAWCRQAVISESCRDAHKGSFLIVSGGSELSTILSLCPELSSLYPSPYIYLRRSLSTTFFTP